MPPPIVEIDCAPRIEDEVGLTGLPDRQQHEPIRVVETLEDETLVLEVMDTGKGAAVEKSLEILLGGVVGDDPAGYDEACTTARRQSLANCARRTTRMCSRRPFRRAGSARIAARTGSVPARCALRWSTPSREPDSWREVPR